MSGRSLDLGQLCVRLQAEGHLGDAWPELGFGAWLASLLLIGFVVDISTLTGAGLGFFTLFLTAFSYGVEISLLAKSPTLVATGLVVLIARFALLRVLSSPRPFSERSAEEV